MNQMVASASKGNQLASKPPLAMLMHLGNYVHLFIH